MFRRHFSEFGRTSRFFGKGDMKYVILDLLRDKSAHGYEIIRDLEDHFQGIYSPSAGTVYPTLQLLEDMEYVKSSEQDGKKIYTITDKGKKFLKEHEEIIAGIKKHMHMCCGGGERAEFQETRRELQDMARFILRKAHRIDREKLGKIRDILSKAYHDIAIIVEEPK